MCPCSGFRSGGTFKCTLVPVFRSGGTSECTLVPVFVPGNIHQNHPFGKPPFCQHPKLRAACLQNETVPEEILISHENRESLNGGLANGGLRYLSTIVHDCLQLPSFRDEGSLKKGRKRATKIIDDCAQIAENGPKPPLRAPI